MQQKQQLSKESVRQTTIDILKSKGQWNENLTKIDVTSWDMEKVLIFYVEVNLISSTMMLSQNWPRQHFSLSKKPILMAFRADQQSAGQGQKQNTWESPLGNIYLTLLMKIQFAYFPYLPIIVISKVFRIVKYFYIRSGGQKTVTIKWINDVMIDFQKVAGVLIKNQMVGQNLFTQIGIGINVENSPSHLQKFASLATSLEEQTGTKNSIKQISNNLLQIGQQFFQQDMNELISKSKKSYEENLAYLNRDVIIYDFKYEKILAIGVFEGINEFGHAIVKGYQKPFVQGRMKIYNFCL